MRLPQFRLALPILALSSAATLLVAQKTENHDDASLDALIAQIPKFEQRYRDGVWLTRDRDALVMQIRAFKAAAVPPMLALLASKREGTRYFAGLVLCNLEGLTEENLDALIEAHKRGERLAILAIGRIGTPRATNYLFSIFPKNFEPEVMFLVGEALALSADQPALAKLCQDKNPLGLEWAGIASIVFSKTSDRGAAVAVQLASIASDGTVSLQNRDSALRLLGTIGLPAAPVVPVLKQLAKAEPEHFSGIVADTIIAIGTADALEYVMPRLAEDPLNGLAKLGKLKENGRPAGAAVVALLKSDKPEVRVFAAETIGYIGYTDGAEVLRGLLSDATDWHLVYAAAESLGRLRDANAIDALRKVEREHAVAFVREAAGKAIQAIEGTATYDWKTHSFYHIFRLQAPTPDEAQDMQDPDALTKSELEQWEYERPTYVPDWLPERFVPDCGVRIGKSVLLASDRGEFGGELVFADETGRARELVRDNIQFLHSMPHGVIAVGGLAHMGICYGSVYRVDFGWNGKPVLRLWKNLPQPPDHIRVREDGSLLVRTAGNDDVVITLEDDARMAAEAKRAEMVRLFLIGALVLVPIAGAILLLKRAADARRSSPKFQSPPSR